MSVVVPLLLSLPPLAAKDVTTIALTLASAVTITAAAAKFNAAVIVATTATTAAIVVNVVALNATIATPIGLASAGTIDIALSAIVANAAALTAAIAATFALASAATPLINNAIALIAAIAFRHCCGCNRTHCRHCHPCHPCCRITIVRQQLPPHFTLLPSSLPHFFCFLIVDC
jgi:hypothetical protein